MICEDKLILHGGACLESLWLVCDWLTLPDLVPLRCNTLVKTLTPKALWGGQEQMVKREVQVSVTGTFFFQKSCVKSLLCSDFEDLKTVTMSSLRATIYGALTARIYINLDFEDPKAVAIFT